MATRTPIPRISKRGRYVIGLLVGVIALLTLSGWFIGLYTNYLWYDSVGYTTVFSTMIWTKILLFAIFGAAMGIWTAAHLYLAHRFRPEVYPHTPEQQSLERYRELLAPKIGWWIAAVGVLVGVFAGASAQGRWEQWLLFSNSRDFGFDDPEFGMDASFYVFRLPFWQYLLGMAFAAVVVAIIVSLGAHYLNGAVRLSGEGERITSAARIHLSSLVALFIALKAVAYYLDRFALVTQHNDVTNLTGGGYTEMNALLRAKDILIWVSVLAAVAIVVFSNAYVRSLLLPGVAVGLVLVSAIALGGIYPAVVRSVSVNPNVPDREGPYTQRSIEATNYAFGMDGLVREPLSAASSPDASGLGDDTGTVPYVRILDPSIVSDTFTSQQQPRGFYDFTDTLNIDRYTDDQGNIQDYVVGVRELNPSNFGADQQDWTVRHNVYTHGYGLVTAPTNVVCDGYPQYTSGSMRSDDADASAQCSDEEQPQYLEVDRPQIYYGELNDDYAIVGKPEGDSDREFDRPSTQEIGEDADVAEEGAEEETGDQYVTYEGDGGVDVSSFFNRMAYAWEFQEMRFLLSDQFNSESQLLYKRNPRERVEDVAPFLTIDGDIFPTVVDGEIVWILDGYTTTNNFPYSDRIDLSSATLDSTTGSGVAAQSDEQINYMSNSVKATVNAYSGEVTLYEFDEGDPILQAWDSIYDGIITPKEETPPELAEHFRYPQDLFKAQRELLQRFHIEDSRTFIEGTEVWEEPEDPREGSTAPQPPYYVVASYPGQEEPTFQLASTFSPRDRSQRMTSMLSGWYNENNEPELGMFEVSTGDATSTRQMYQNMTLNDVVVDDLRQFEQTGLTIDYGNPLALPLGDGILYVEPLYLRRQVQGGGAGTTLPQLQRVMLAYGDRLIAYEDTFEAAVESLVNQYIGDEELLTDQGTDDTETPPDEQDQQTDETPTTDPTTPPPVDEDVASDPDVSAAADRMRDAVTALTEARQAGDYQAEADAWEELSAAIEAYDDAVAAAEGGGTGG